MAGMAKIDPHPSFVIHGGDAYPHSYTDKTKMLDAIYNSTTELKKQFPDTQVIYALGNHDCNPQHCVLPQSEWLASVADRLQEFFTPEQMRTFKKGGYYTANAGGYKLIVVNTVFYYYQNQYTSNLTNDDVGDQFAFIRSELQSAQLNQEKVLIVGHIAPGYDEREGNKMFGFQSFNDKYVKVFEGFEGIIKGQFYGHLHSDTFRLTKDNGVMLLSPALDPQFPYWSYVETANNPGAGRRYHYDPESLELLSYEQFYFTIEQANADKEVKLVLEYDTRQEPYSLRDLSLASFQELTRRLEAEPQLFESYLKYNVVSYPHAPCNNSCRRKHLCTIKYTLFDEYFSCLNSDSIATQVA